MDRFKRKQSANSVNDDKDEDKRKQRKADGDDGNTKESDDDRKMMTVNDEDVEEFYAIVQRIHEASRCIAASNGVGKTERWRPAFVREDFEVGVKDDRDRKDVSGGNKEEEEEEEGTTIGRLVLDLNADPEPEGGTRSAWCPTRPA